MTYRAICLATVFLLAALALMLIFAPGLVYWLFAVEAHPTADFLSRRVGAVFAGIAVLLALLARETDACSQARVSNGMIAVMLFLAAMGVFELIRGTVGPGILLASGTEIAFAAAFWRVKQAR